MLSSKQIHQAAAQGVSGQSQKLPHLEQMQPLFGGHDLTNVQAYVGREAGTANEAIGAQAFASGNKVAFKANPSLHTAAHEAAHVVQQRAGVRLDGGVGRAGDAYEQHADRVADAVVQGRDASSMLAPGSTSDTETQAAPVQLKGEDGKKVVTGTAMARLGKAEEANQYTKGVLKFGAGNQIEALDASKFNSNFRLGVVRTPWFWNITAEADKIAATNESAEMAAKAEIAQGGNCGEHAHIAYNYLRHAAVGQEIAVASVSGFDHAFTFVGPSGGTKDMSQTAVSDPWPTAPKAVLWEDHFAKPQMTQPSDLNTEGNMVADGGKPIELIKAGLSLTDQGKAYLAKSKSSAEVQQEFKQHEEDRAEKHKLQGAQKVLVDRWNVLEAKASGGTLSEEQKAKVDKEMKEIAKEYEANKEKIKKLVIWMWGQENAHLDGHDFEYIQEEIKEPEPEVEPEPAWMVKMWRAIQSWL